MSAGEREDAERFFIRYYQDCPEQQLPRRYSGRDTHSHMFMTLLKEAAFLMDELFFMCFTLLEQN